jgi:hypothetical protein
MKGAEDPVLDPRTEPARIRAFFVRPDAALGFSPIESVALPLVQGVELPLVRMRRRIDYV